MEKGREIKCWRWKRGGEAKRGREGEVWENGETGKKQLRLNGMGNK